MMSIRRLVDHREEVVTTSEMRLRAAGISLWSMKSVEEYKQKKLRDTRWCVTRSITCWMSYVGIALIMPAVMHSLEATLLTSGLFVVLVGLALFAFVISLKWETSRVGVCSWKYFDGVRDRPIPSVIIGIAERARAALPGGHFEVSYMRDDPVLWYIKDGERFAPVVWDELDNGQTVIIEESGN